MEGLLPVNVHERKTWKIEQNKKISGIPFTLEKLRETASRHKKLD
jgi:hypothetical protein